MNETEIAEMKLAMTHMEADMADMKAQMPERQHEQEAFIKVSRMIRLIVFFVYFILQK